MQQGCIQRALKGEGTKQKRKEEEEEKEGPQLCPGIIVPVVLNYLCLLPLRTASSPPLRFLLIIMLLCHPEGSHVVQTWPVVIP